MSKSPYASEQDKLERYVNSFATQSFRDQADRDYIAARLACRSELMPQFLWAAHQAIEKYFKAILLYNRIPAKSVRHSLRKALELSKNLPFTIELSARSQDFINHLSEYGEFRYIDIPYHVEGYLMIDLDRTVWDLRRYCQVLNIFGKVLPIEEQVRLDEAKARLENSSSDRKHKFHLNGGVLEAILKDKKHSSRPALIWNNPFYGTRARPKVRARWHIHAQNSLLYLYPEMLDELLKYVLIPDRLADGYRTHLAAIKADPASRP